jgi:PAS domain S-box-containing protein
VSSINSEPSLLSLEKILEKITEVTLQIQQSQSLDEVLQWTIADVRALLQTDRVLIYRFLANEDAVIAFESVGSTWEPLIGQLIYDACLQETWAERYRQGQITSIADIHAGHLHTCHVELLERLQVQANLVVPILNQNNLWGLLIAHHCRSTREWQSLEVQYLQQMALHLGIAIQQADLQQSYQSLQAEVEQRPIVEALTDRQETKAALQEREYYYAQILDALQEMVFCKAPGSIVVYANKAACDYYGMTLEELHGITDVPFNQLDFTQQYLQDDLHVFTTGEVVNRAEEPNQRSDGEIRYFHTIKSPIFDADGNVSQIVGIARDVTERQQAESLLRRYERIVSATTDGVSLVDRNYIYQVVNQTYLAWNQKSYDAIVGHSVSDLLGQEFFETVAKPRLDRCLAGAVQQIIETWQTYADGQRRYIRATYTPYVELDGTISGVVINLHDLTELKQVEEALRLQSTALEACADIVIITDRQGNIEWANPAFTKITGYFLEEAIGKNPDELLHSGQHSSHFHQSLWQTILSGQTWRGEMISRRKDGSLYPEAATITPVRDAQGNIHHFVAIKQDISDRKQNELATQQQTERERMIQAITGRIRQSLDLNQILYTTVTEVRQVLAADRVLIYRFNSDWSGVVIAESISEGWQSLLGIQMANTYFIETEGQLYLQEKSRAINDIYTAGLAPCHIEMLEQIQVKAKLVVPILQENNHLWGLLIAHHCQSPRQWQPFEIALQQQLATQIAIAIQQSELYEQVQTLNTNLELQVQERTAQLQQALDFEALLKRITDKVRDSLDESQILQTAVQELATELDIECCDAALYNLEHRTSTVAYEHIHARVTPAKGLVFSMDANPGIYNQLLQGQCIQFCFTSLWTSNYRDTIDQQSAILGCPFQNEQGVIGDMWLFKPQQECFSDAEIRLVQQIANQCAIALRQSRLYQTAQAQVQELERLNQLKDDFLSTVSHELRSPMSNIKMATQMLEISLNHLDILTDKSSPVNRYFNILREEGQREINLINDLLDLARLDAGTDFLNFTEVNLQVYLPHLAETFVERMRQQQQHFVLQIPSDLPPLPTDEPYLERILTELLHNACKYTPSGETITVSVQATTAGMEIRISNSGVEISPTEYERIFGKFYRIPNNDPWKYGGTGLGLALVKKLVERLGGNIGVESGDGQTTFILEFGFS